MGWLLLILFVLGLTGFVLMAPRTVVSMLPGATRLYAALGMPINAKGLAFQGVNYGWNQEGEETVLEVKGDIVNLTDAADQAADRRGGSARRERQGIVAIHYGGERRAARRRRGCALPRRDRIAAGGGPQAESTTRQGAMIAMQAAGDAKIEPLYSSGDIQRRIDELARDIAASSLKEPLIVAILKGSFIFAADLIRALHREGLGA